MLKRTGGHWAALSLFLLLYTGGLIVLVPAAVSLIGRTPDSSWDTLWFWTDPDVEVGLMGWLSWSVIPVLIIVATQIVFVAPIVSFKPDVRSGGRPMMLSLIAIAVVAAALVVGLLCAVLALLDIWGDTLNLDRALWGWPVIPLIFVASWALWSWLFLLFTRKKREQGLLGRLVGLLLGGTVIEVLAVLPIDLMVRRRTDCYCSTGTFNALLFSTLAAIWLAGPGVLILYLRRRRQVPKIE